MVLILTAILVVAVAAVILMFWWRGTKRESLSVAPEPSPQVETFVSKPEVPQVKVQAAPSQKSEDSYDVFISYRRQSDSQTARLIRSELRHQGLRVFLDVDDLTPGIFDRALLDRIANSPNFLIILSARSLEHCGEEGDWMRQEIAQAVRTKRNIVPITMPDFQFPEPASLPPEIRVLSNHQSVTYSHEFFDAMVSKIIRYLKTTG